MTVDAALLEREFRRGLPYQAYLETNPKKAEPWRVVGEQVELNPDQRRLLDSFRRDIHVLVLTGIWCGDCAQQGPLIHAIAEANPDRIHVRWLERDNHPDLQREVRINAGDRVPVVVFAAEDFEPVAIRGDRTLSRYRALAAKQLGGACPLPGAPVPQDELNATLQDWIDEFERVHLLLRLSGRLRQKHGD